MPRSNEVNTEFPTASEPDNKWKAKARTDGDIRLPKKLRAELGIGGHSVYEISTEKQGKNGNSFTLRFTRAD